MGESGKVRCPGVAPCDLFLFILNEIGGNAKVNANVFRSLWKSPETFTERHKAWISKPSSWSF